MITYMLGPMLTTLITDNIATISISTAFTFGFSQRYLYIMSVSPPPMKKHTEKKNPAYHNQIQFRMRATIVEDNPTNNIWYPVVALTTRGFILRNSIAAIIQSPDPIPITPCRKPPTRPPRRTMVNLQGLLRLTSQTYLTFLQKDSLQQVNLQMKQMNPAEIRANIQRYTMQAVYDWRTSISLLAMRDITQNIVNITKLMKMSLQWYPLSQMSRSFSYCLQQYAASESSSPKSPTSVFLDFFDGVDICKGNAFGIQIRRSSLWTVVERLTHFLKKQQEKNRNINIIKISCTNSGTTLITATPYVVPILTQGMRISTKLQSTSDPTLKGLRLGMSRMKLARAAPSTIGQENTVALGVGQSRKAIRRGTLQMPAESPTKLQNMVPMGSKEQTMMVSHRGWKNPKCLQREFQQMQRQGQVWVDWYRILQLINIV